MRRPRLASGSRTTLRSSWLRQTEKIVAATLCETSSAPGWFRRPGASLAS